MEEIRIRPATVEDVGLILRHRTAMFSDMGYQDEARLALMRASSEAFLRRGMVDGTYQGWLAAAADGRVVAGGGVAIVPWSGSPEDPAPRRGWILNIYTEPAFRHRGLARQIMETIVGWCRAEGFLTVSLHASPFGRPLYESMGFRQTNEMRLYLDQWPRPSGSRESTAGTSPGVTSLRDG
ncbi:MAG TPA: GNAT family N-acetyltransferase [Candidatus Acidoferrales bacterium]|jgi:GNAT superfamily N-acetyltransferase|nr:GNAT family N-acetyltransferase [Candidatus Acidoferrales bacterium]